MIRKNAWGLDNHSDVHEEGRRLRAQNPLTPEKIAEVKRLFPGWKPPEER